jgi:hypothetical protein
MLLAMVSIYAYMASMGSSYRYYEEAVFSPGQVEAVTGVSPAQQRLWRHRGILQKRIESHPRFTPRELAEIAVLRDLEENTGQDLAVAAAHARQVAPYVLGFAVANPDAWIVKGPLPYKDQLRRYLENTTARFGPQAISHLMGIVKGDYGRFSIRSAVGLEIVSDLNDALSKTPRNVSVIVDHLEAGRLLVDAIAKHSETPLYWVVGIDEAKDIKDNDDILLKDAREASRRRLRIILNRP